VRPDNVRRCDPSLFITTTPPAELALKAIASPFGDQIGGDQS
jgi:hypothetical protein